MTHLRFRCLLVTIIPALLSLSASAYAADDTVPLAIIAGTNLQTPDGGVRRVTLLGRPFDDRGFYMTALYLRVDGGDPVMLPEEAGNGYEPSLQPCDVTGDGMEEIFITAATGGSGGIVNGLICRIGGDGGVTVIFDTGQGVLTPITGRFLDGYRAELSVADTTVTIDLSARKESYDQLGVYADGIHIGSMEPWADAYGLLELQDADGVCRLAGWQSVSGTIHVDRIVHVKSVMEWMEGGWRIAGIEIAPVGDARIE